MGAGHSTHGGGSSGSTTTAGAVLVSPRHRRQSRTPSRHAQTPPLAGGTALDAQLQPPPQQQCHHHRHLHLPHIQGSRRASCVPLTPSSHATTLLLTAPQPPPSLTPLPLSQQQQQQQQQQHSSSSSSRRCSARKKCSVTSSSERMLLHGDNGAEHRSSVCVRRLGNVSAYTSPQATPRTLLSLGKSAALHTCMHTPHLHTLVDKLTTASSTTTTTTATATATNTTTTTPATEALRVVTTRNDDQQQQQQQQQSKCDKVRCARDAVAVRQCVAQAKQHERGEQKQQQHHQQQSQQKASAVLSIATAHLWRMAVQWVAVTEVALVTDWCARRARSAHGPHAAGAVSSSSPAANATAAAVEVPLSCDAVPFPYNRTTCIVYTPSCDVTHNNSSCSSSSGGGGRGNVAAAAAACASGLPAELPVGEAYYNALCAAWRQPAAESVVRNNNSNDVPLALPPVADEDDLDDSLILESIEEAVSCEFSPAIPLQHMIALLVPEWEEEGLYDDPL